MGYQGLVIGGLVAAVSFAATAEAEQPALPAPAEGTAEPAAQVLKPGSPEWVAREYLTAIRERGFSAAADFMHPDEMARFKSLLIPVFAAESESGGRALMNATFGRDARMREARLADPGEFLRRFSRVMAVRMPDQPTDYDRLRVLGTVKEVERFHVLVRLSAGAETAAEDRLEVVSLLPFAGGWKLALSPKLEAAARAMDRRKSGTRPAPLLGPRLEPPEPTPLQPPEIAPARPETPAAAAPGAGPPGVEAPVTRAPATSVPR
jgi:hypothetical protein